jgi:serine acetyltransferase
MERLIIFGDRTAAEMKQIVDEACPDRFRSTATCFVDTDGGWSAALDEHAELQASGNQVCFLLGLGDQRLRQLAAEYAKGRDWQAFTFVHPTAYVAESATIGAGSFIAPTACVGHGARLGQHCLVHYQASVGHDSVLGDDCWVLPGARISGQVTLQERVLIGSNAFLFQGVTLGRNVQVDALTYVRDDIAEGSVVSVRRPQLPRKG